MLVVRCDGEGLGGPLWRPKYDEGRPCERSAVFDGSYGSFARYSGLTFFQPDSSAPEVLFAAHAFGAHGISVMRCRFDRGRHILPLSVAGSGQLVHAAIENAKSGALFSYRWCGR